MGFPGGSLVNNPPANVGDTVESLGQKDPLKKEMVTCSSILAGEISGQRSLVGYRPWGCKKSDMRLKNKKCLES